jgi:hypothetical protein
MRQYSQADTALNSLGLNEFRIDGRLFVGQRRRDYAAQGGYSPEKKTLPKQNDLSGTQPQDSRQSFSCHSLKEIQFTQQMPR